MRAFIVLCLVATACAQYNYQVGGGSDGTSASLSSSAVGSNSASFEAVNAGGNIASGISGGSSFGVSSNAAPAIGTISSYGVSSSGPSLAATTSSYSAPAFTATSEGSIGGTANIVSGQTGASFTSSSSAPAFTATSVGTTGGASNFAPAQAELEKEFYTFTANEEDFSEPAGSNQINAIAKQGLRVIFIKGPENTGLEDAVLGLAKSAAEQKTAIYVLNKQADLSALAEKLNTASGDVNHKPEVHFVKYRTPEDAANAQKAIQAQYDALGGKSEHFNGGVAPSLNFASAAPAATAGQQSGSFQSGTVGQQVGSFQAATGVQQGGSFQVATDGQQSGSFQTGTVGQQVGSFQAATGVQQGGSFQAATSSTYLPASIIRRYRA
ncbi:uncharacterized transmembrane protein DDB_G0289901-like [Musca vetustissima]|uniref:uncharacterized transmembrane protein DDB_G0289901-like n=1 Tax=Musca vetustissima TaxID=27455 RepID=UPI002AB750CD|nr:uncharacterized transmembrane protein DDB_G0289901-like [Musca vetustissima]